ncbi:unnamed protein product [Owenia fusiformis]|uniref:Uncharacterized protein n=1 Tax=Owenia fusiformis TaxID=6347 RepID=A0A8S4N6U7_OWEFU|nr:unnamed protein product [Owenia fusiformis]
MATGYSDEIPETRERHVNYHETSMQADDLIEKMSTLTTQPPLKFTDELQMNRPSRITKRPTIADRHLREQLLELEKQLRDKDQEYKQMEEHYRSMLLQKQEKSLAQDNHEVTFDLTQEARTSTPKAPHQEVYRKEPKISKFSGKADQDVNEWIDDAKRAIKKVRKEDIYDYIMMNLEGMPKKEVRHLGDNAYPEEIFTTLKRVYGGHQTKHTALQVFLNTKQQSTEDIKSYSQRLMTQQEQLQNTNDDFLGMEDTSKLMKTQFASGVSSEMMRLMLHNKLKERPNITFTALREEAFMIEERIKMRPITETKQEPIKTSSPESKAIEDLIQKQVQKEVQSAFTSATSDNQRNFPNRRGRGAYHNSYHSRNHWNNYQLDQNENHNFYNPQTRRGRGYSNTYANRNYFYRDRESGYPRGIGSPNTDYQNNDGRANQWGNRNSYRDTHNPPTEPKN